MHKDHRERLKRRLLSEGLDGFEAYNALELFLFFSIPRRDTNELAHRLLDRFGSFSAVFDAPYEQLLTVGGVGEHTATMIKLIPQLFRYYITDKNSPREIYDTSRKLGEFFIGKFTGETVETIYMVTLDGRYRMINCVCLCRGSVNSSHITPRMLIEQALRDSASMAVIAHNHPGGLPIPSSDDIATTRVMYEALAVVDVCLLEHFVVAGDKYTPIMSGHMGKLGQKTPNESKYSNFYHEA